MNKLNLLSYLCPPLPRSPSTPPSTHPTEAGAGPLAGIISSIGVALLGAASGYFAYQKKKLCFKIQGGLCFFCFFKLFSISEDDCPKNVAIRTLTLIPCFFSPQINTGQDPEHGNGQVRSDPQGNFSFISFSLLMVTKWQ